MTRRLTMRAGHAHPHRAIRLEPDRSRSAKSDARLLRALRRRSISSIASLREREARAPALGQASTQAVAPLLRLQRDRLIRAFASAMHRRAPSHESPLLQALSEMHLHL